MLYFEFFIIIHFYKANTCFQNRYCVFGNVIVSKYTNIYTINEFNLLKIVKVVAGGVEDCVGEGGGIERRIKIREKLMGMNNSVVIRGVRGNWGSGVEG